MKDRIAAVALLCLLLLPASAGAQAPGLQSTCIDCHAELAEELAAPVEAWQGSIHAQNGVSCQNCHGGDPTLAGMEAMSADNGFEGIPAPALVPDFCGRCHAGVMQDYTASAHGQALASGGPHCVTCHGSHAVERATLALINRDACTACHAYGRADEIRNALSRTDETISELEEALKELHRIGIDTERLEKTVFSIRNEFHRLFHSVDVERIRQQTAEFLSRLATVEASIADIRGHLKFRHSAGAFAVGLLALATILCFYLRRLYHRKEQTER